MLSRRPFTSTILHGEYISVSTTLEAEVSRQVSILSQILSPQLIFESQNLVTLVNPRILALPPATLLTVDRLFVSMREAGRHPLQGELGRCMNRRRWASR